MSWYHNYTEICFVYTHNSNGGDVLMCWDTKIREHKLTILRVVFDEGIVRGRPIRK